MLGEQMFLASLLPTCIKCSLHLFAIISSFISFPCISSTDIFELLFCIGFINEFIIDHVVLLLSKDLV